MIEIKVPRQNGFLKINGLLARARGFRDSFRWAAQADIQSFEEKRGGAPEPEPEPAPTVRPPSATSIPARTLALHSYAMNHCYYHLNEHAPNRAQNHVRSVHGIAMVPNTLSADQIQSVQCAD